MKEWPGEAREAVANALDGSEIRGGMTHHRSLPLTERHKNDIDSILEALREHVTPTAPLRGLADGWDALADIAKPGYSEILRRAANKLREVIDREL